MKCLDFFEIHFLDSVSVFVGADNTLSVPAFEGDKNKSAQSFLPLSRGGLEDI